MKVRLDEEQGDIQVNHSTPVYLNNITGEHEVGPVNLKINTNNHVQLIEIGLMSAITNVSTEVVKIQLETYCKIYICVKNVRLMNFMLYDIGAQIM